jgi:hypothetical protein
MNTMQDQNDFELRHNLRDTILLLGGKQEIAHLLKKSQDGLVTEADVETLRSYNIELFTETKLRLASLNQLRLESVGVTDKP